MKFQRIGTGLTLARIATFSLMLLAASQAYAVDEDIPPPVDADLPPARANSAPIQSKDSVLNEDESIPAPSLGDESLPEPSVDRGQERAKNQVNRPPEDDEIFLPTPNVNDNVYYAPVGTPAPRVSSEDLDWRYINTNRPMFSLLIGPAFKTYPNVLVKGNRITGILAGASLRFLSLAQTLFVHLYSDFEFYSLGDVGTDGTNSRGEFVPGVANVKDTTFHVGPMLELGLGRRFSLFGSLLRRNAMVTASKLGVLNADKQNVQNLNEIGEEPTWYLGAGLQWDFWVIPHASVGLKAHAEKDIYSLVLTLAIEPAPRKKLNLNFDEMPTSY